ncbi:hypothetical protein CERZMDRAFT_88688 [Cercospora zeae-maydis SCOH1-5]|uniref:Uncharacterized protein n=1 Tax=Cercospora zeae-maydis SCOH1-5 TaxID=717836 RepID=A0A6A6F1Z8_9PEZI|nr:hypothetical protein CERZMDRAFT_88688 [Cercospora zeae-maydis SCOH1-5]
MRNNIYELVCVNDTSKDNKIDLLKAALPSNALIRTCRQISQRGRGALQAKLPRVLVTITLHSTQAQTRHDPARNHADRLASHAAHHPTANDADEIEWEQFDFLYNCSRLDEFLFDIGPSRQASLAEQVADIIDSIDL